MTLAWLKMKNATYVSSTETLRQRYIFPSSLAHWAICSIISEYKTQPEKHTQEAEVLSSSLQPVKSLPDRWYPGQKKKKNSRSLAAAVVDAHCCDHSSNRRQLKCTHQHLYHLGAFLSSKFKQPNREKTQTEQWDKNRILKGASKHVLRDPSGN